eukprot:CAMPEP_0197828948 /NCGR_PEP_ID=MMETSP1437-20131217/5434_1 /TAXON_ID=49252 ORGANISM="Eucampia antarctica, Strain CCMP1452" /NCGR_SAMPLE_ID=MMETSP1437 /ASSEMBLY_ACC=CAM_ASM_001096 /LENGTH=803 /DNA_ID=CAMNT_0043430375 /DNA_START=28 /DNA_END=2439 /DNA_ORIENTATION=+
MSEGTTTTTAAAAVMIGGDDDNGATVAATDDNNNKWDGNSMTQTDMMEKDTVLVLDDDDNVIGSESKRGAHEFRADQPRGILHRAFSVFLFDESTGELLLQKRASSKITFPNVWTNTCCSHPLHGMVPSEVDGPKDVADGTVMGVKNASIRKLDHELGIPPAQLSVDGFKFLTRLHYWAADTVTHGPQSPWGEHEIDYVLFYTVSSKDKVTITPHPDEVDDVKWVTKSQLISMMEDSSLLFSPWFRLIFEKWMLPNSTQSWWNDDDNNNSISKTMTTNVHCDYVNIHVFDPPPEHMGGLGNAGPLFSAVKSTTITSSIKSEGDPLKKQGAYGKIKTHSESKISQILRFDEVLAAVNLKYINPLKANFDNEYVRNNFVTEDIEFCDHILNKVSRSFTAVVRQLPSILLVDIMVFYLVLRALDTIEDDMTAFSSNEVKIQHLLSFHKNALQNPNWSLDGVGEGDEKVLLQQFPKCHSVYSDLTAGSRRVIADITQRMAAGMAEFVDKDLGQGTVLIAEYNRYCHFVAGLVGEGLSRLFAECGLEPQMAKEIFLSDRMGLFLQKTNIIRDYLEDYVDGRAFWPQSVWKKYSKSGDLGYFASQSSDEVKARSLFCLNELVTDALEIVPDCLSYLDKLTCYEIFRFCAIPQVMAIATLDKCYANLDVFTGVVKIRKGLACKLINSTTDLEAVKNVFYNIATNIIHTAQKERKNGLHDPSFDRTMKICQTICNITSSSYNMIQKREHIFYSLALASVSGLYLKKPQITLGASAAFTAFALGPLFGMGPQRSALKPAAASYKQCEDTKED